MAVQNAGLGKGPDPAMQDQTSFNARNGAAKKPQTDFPIHPGMTDQQRAMVGVSPPNPGSGPDAVSTNPQAGVPIRGEDGDVLKASWDMKDANGKGVDSGLGGRVIGEAILAGSASLPTDENYSKGSPGKP